VLAINFAKSRIAVDAWVSHQPAVDGFKLWRRRACGNRVNRVLSSATPLANRTLKSDGWDFDIKCAALPGLQQFFPPMC
jgi:hypothetical protein